MGRLCDAWRALRGKSAGSARQEWARLSEFLGVDPDAGPEAMSEATYYACLKTLSESVGKLPCKLLRRSASNGVEAMRGHPLYGVLSERPNRFMTAAGGCGVGIAGSPAIAGRHGTGGCSYFGMAG